MEINGVSYDVVALRKESVDRNNSFPKKGQANNKSLSARRAWIESQTLYGAVSCPLVALRKEGVDRNADGAVSGSGDYVALRKESVDRNTGSAQVSGVPSKVSLSARRAWIEMLLSSTIS